MVVFKILDRIENVLASIGIALIAAMLTSIVIEVVVRYLFNITFSWTVEFNSYILLYIPFLGAGWLLREGGHVTVDVLEEYLPSKVIHVFDYIVAISGLIVGITLTIYGFNVTLDMFVNNTKSLTVAKFPLGYIIMIIPIGSFVLLLEFTRKLYHLIYIKKYST